MVESIDECDVFEPNPWDARKCKNCLRSHGLGTPSSAPPSRRSSMTLLAPLTPLSPFTAVASLKLHESDSPASCPPISEGICTSFKSQQWRPSICIHCFKSRGSHSPSAFNTDYFSSPPSHPPLTKFSSLDLTEPSSPFTSFSPASGSFDSFTDTPLPSLHFPPRSPSSPSTTFTDIHSEADEDDPFKDFEELTDDFQLEIKTTTTIVNSAKGSIGISTTIDSLNYVPSPRSRQSPSVKQFNKWEEHEDDWDYGVEVNFDHVSKDLSYVGNKMMELNSVKQEANRTKQDLYDNPTLATALFEILDAKQKQIQMALDRSKINVQDHSQLLESLDSIRTMITSSTNACTF
eukprot:TRINITY_DN18673_c0_g1_i1.p1 TRINITY_DN18673_c0_g1~~TRINITY_DN18673_c0_g1_i1.p1  ORF type:complete len:348 (-),score=97.76 TRINITY_DN18673_c0_g1_i1:67-1110(-)